jgi:hypothetical protein
MSLTLSTPITGGPQTGFTSPTYTITADNAPPNVAGKQYAVTAIGGTQAGVDTTSSVSRPFTITGSRPGTLRSLGPVDPVTGALRSVPRNTFTWVVRKGVTPLAGQSPVTLLAKLTVDVPAGADIADAPNVRAAMSLLIGALNQVSSSFGDTLISGVI